MRILCYFGFHTWGAWFNEDIGNLNRNDFPKFRFCVRCADVDWAAKEDTNERQRAC